MDEDLTLRALDALAIRKEHGNADSDEDPDDRSDMSIASVDRSETGLSLSVRDHITLNQGNFADRFQYRVLGKQKVVLWKSAEDAEKFKPVHASTLTLYKFMNPILYRSVGLFKRGSLQQFIRICRLKRREDPAALDEQWEGLKQYINDTKTLDHFELSLESESRLSHWFEGLCDQVSAHITKKSVVLRSEVLLGLSGALVYTDPLTGVMDPEAGYIGKADRVFPHGPSGYFAGVEFKLASDCQQNVLWYTLRAGLAQSMCWLSGAIESRVGLIVCNLGMKLLYRIPRECEDREGHLVFDYYCYPPADAITGRSFFLPCRGAAAKKGLEDLLRVVYELVKVTRKSPAVPTRPATPRQSRAQSRPPMTNSPRRQRSESSDDNLPKRRMSASLF